MTAFAIPLNPTPSPLDVLGKLSKDALSKVPKGKVPTGVPNSTISHVDRIIATEVLRELYGADFDTKKYLEEVNRRLAEWESTRVTTIEEVVSRKEKYVPVVGDPPPVALPPGQTFDFSVQLTVTKTDSIDGDVTFEETRWLRDVSGTLLPPYGIEVEPYTNNNTRYSSETNYRWGYVTESGQTITRYLGSNRIGVRLGKADVTTTTIIGDIVGYPDGDLTREPWTLPTVVLQVESTITLVPRSRTIWNPVYPDSIPVPVHPPVDTPVDSSTDNPVTDGVTDGVDTSTDTPTTDVNANEITLNPPAVADPPVVSINEPVIPIPVEIVPQFELEIPLNEPLIDNPVDMAINPPPVPLDPATTPLPPEFSTADDSISISDPFLPPGEIDITDRSIPTQELTPTQQKAWEESINSFETVNFVNPLVNGIPVPVSNVGANVCQTSANPCQGQLDTGIKGNQKKLDDQALQLDRLLNGAGAVGQVIDLAILNRIDTKLGAQLPGGIGGKLSGLSRRMKLPEIFNVLAFLATLHNAAMLSKNLAVTMGDIATLGLQVVGLKDEDGEAHNVNEIIGDTVNNMMKNLLGEEVWTDTKDTWKSANRMYQTAANIVYSVGSMVDSARSIGEWTGENLGKIGNALKSAGVVASNAYNWMPEQINAASGRIRSLQKMRDGINNLDSSVSAFGSVVSEVSSIQTEVNEMRTKKEQFEKDLEKLAPKEAKDNEKVKEREDQLETDNKAPEYNRDDLQRAD